MSRARVRAVALATVSGILISIVAALMLPVGAITLFARGGCTHGSPRCRAERSLPSTVCGFACTIHADSQRHKRFISRITHLLLICSSGRSRPSNCRFFLSGFLRKLVPLGIISWMMGTFFTVPQQFPEERRRILRSRGRDVEAHGRVCLSQSRRVAASPTGRSGISTRARFIWRRCCGHRSFPCISTSRPGSIRRGLDARPGTVDIHILPPVHTTEWSEANVVENKERVREIFVRAHQEMRCA